MKNTAHMLALHVCLDVTLLSLKACLQLKMAAEGSTLFHMYFLPLIVRGAGVDHHSIWASVTASNFILAC